MTWTTGPGEDTGWVAVGEVRVVVEGQLHAAVKGTIFHH